MLTEGADSMQGASEVAAAAMLSAGEAIAGGSQQIEQTIVSMITNVLRSLPGVGGLGGVLIGGIGGILGAALGRRSDPVPVRVADMDERAAAKLRESSREPIIIKNITEVDGVMVGEIERIIYDREQRDATRRR